MNKRDLERKIREEQEATAHVFQEFINIFQEAPNSSKIFVKSEVLYADKNLLTPLESEVYSPTPLIKSSTAMRNALECAKLLKDEKPEKTKMNKKEKPKSNLELLKEELKLRHSEKEERERLKEEIAMSGPALSFFDGGDPNSTNLFIANLNPNVTEADLVHIFGVYGPLASVKIMWPRGEDRFLNLNTNCGFVAYMSRRDAERALNNLRHRTDMRVGWGKSVEVPTLPVYIPEELLRLYLPPPRSGLPFNAQPSKILDSFEDLDDVLPTSVIKVTIPLNKKVLMLVHRMIEFVVKEGPLFEAMIMNNEIGNREYNFLFENKSPVHVYYRWKLYSILQGDGTKEWTKKPFRMFTGGSIWLPPVVHDYQAGMPDELINEKYNSSLLSENQSERLVDLIQNLSLSRDSIKEAMIFCLNHGSAINDSLKIIVESLCRLSTKPPNKIARLYVFYDVLNNCLKNNVDVTDIQNKVETVLGDIYNCFIDIYQEYDKMLFGTKVLRVARQLDTICVLPLEFIKKFEDYCNQRPEIVDESNSSSDEPLDGANLRKRSLKGSGDECVITPTLVTPKEETKVKQEYFVPSKWDTIDPEEVESQSMSSTKLYYMELETKLEKENRDTKTSHKEYSVSKDKTKKRKTEKDERYSERYFRKDKDKKRKLMKGLC